MQSADWKTTLHGSCHCGKLRLEFSSNQSPENFTPRACDCSFCRKHGAAYISDPVGRLSITAKRTALRRYRQGSNNAEFLLCGECGVLVAVVFAQTARLYGAINVGCLDAGESLGASIPASPQTLAPDEKVSRWLALWVPDVELIESAA